MVAVKAAEVERAVAARSPDIGLLLFYGPDAGRIAERAKAAARAGVDDPDDAFQLIRLDGDALADEPSRLVEEATTFGMFGGRRAIWVRPTSRNIAPAILACLETKLVDTLVVIEAGDLQKSSPLRSAVEKSARAIALPCYSDDDRDLATIITSALSEHGLRIDPEARQLLADHLGGDRLTTRGELEKLALYAHGHAQVSSEDVEAIVSDVSGPSIDGVIDAAFAGHSAALDEGLVQLSQSGVGQGGVLPLALRHGLALLAARTRLDDGQSLDFVLRAWRGLHFRREPLIRRQIRDWSVEAIHDAVHRIQAAILDTRRNPQLIPSLTGECLFGLVGAASGVRAPKSPKS